MYVHQISKLAAERLLAMKHVTDDTERVTLATRWALGRSPLETELDAALKLVNEVHSIVEGDQKKAAAVDAWSAWFLTLFSTAEFRYLVDVQ